MSLLSYIMEKATKMCTKQAKAMGQSQEAKTHALCVVEGLEIWFASDNQKAKHLGFQDGILPSAVRRCNIIMLLH